MSTAFLYTELQAGRTAIATITLLKFYRSVVCLWKNFDILVEGSNSVKGWVLIHKYMRTHTNCEGRAWDEDSALSSHGALLPCEEPSCPEELQSTPSRFAVFEFLANFHILGLCFSCSVSSSPALFFVEKKRFHTAEKMVAETKLHSVQSNFTCVLISLRWEKLRRDTSGTFPIPPSLCFPFRVDELKSKGRLCLGFCGIKATLPQMEQLSVHIQVSRQQMGPREEGLRISLN